MYYSDTQYRQVANSYESAIFNDSPDCKAVESCQLFNLTRAKRPCAQ